MNDIFGVQPDQGGITLEVNANSASTSDEEQSPSKKHKSGGLVDYSDQINYQMIDYKLADNRDNEDYMNTVIGEEETAPIVGNIEDNAKKNEDVDIPQQNVEGVNEVHEEHNEGGSDSHMELDNKNI